MGFLTVLLLSLSLVFAQEPISLEQKGFELERCIDDVFVQARIRDVQTIVRVRNARFDLATCWQESMRAQVIAADEVMRSRERQEDLLFEQQEVFSEWMRLYRFQEGNQTVLVRHQKAVLRQRPAWLDQPLVVYLEQSPRQNNVTLFFLTERHLRQVERDLVQEERIEARAIEFVSLYGNLSHEIVQIMDLLQAAEIALQIESEGVR